MNSIILKDVLGEEHFNLYNVNYAQLINNCNNIGEVIKCENNPARFIKEENSILMLIDVNIYDFRNIKSYIDISNKYDISNDVLRIRAFIIEIIELSVDLKKAIESKDDVLLKKYHRLLSDKLNMNI